MEARPILVIDDDADVRDVVTELLREEGYDAVAAPGGREALQLLEAGMRPGLILLDMMMPGMDGRQFRVEQMKRAEWAAIPTVVFSAYVDVAETARSIGAAGSLKKPLRMEALLEVVGRFLGPPGRTNPVDA